MRGPHEGSRFTAIALPFSDNITFSDSIKGREIMTKRSSIVFAAIIASSALMSVGAWAQDAAKCTKAAECTGPLPMICMACRGGHEECAHWACVKHACKVEICGLHGTYKP
jgi:hypothetical protein